MIDTTTQEVTADNFPSVVLESVLPTLVDFWAPWCGPCRVVAQILEKIALENDKVEVVRLNIDEYPQLANEYTVMSIPTMILFKDGVEVKRLVGLRPQHEIEAGIESFLG